MDKIIAFGIVCDKKTSISLLHASHRVSINGFTAHVNIEAEYINESQHKTDAKFVFPVEEDSAVYKFEATIADVHLVAKAKDKDVAQTEYKEAVEKGQSTILLRETRTSGDIFEYSLGNIPPKQKINLQICLVTELTCEVDGAVRFYMPFVLNPRYGLTPRDESYHNTPKPQQFSFESTIQWNLPIKDVKSENSIRVEYQKNRSFAIVRLTEKFNFEKDLLLRIYYEDVEKPQVIFEKGDSQAKGMFSKDVMMINLFPKLPQVKDSAANDYIFFIDCSGSMNGDKFETAKDTLLLFLKSLPLGSSFNVIAFNNYSEVLFKGGSREYNEDSLNEAMKFLCNLYAAGGTELLNAIKFLSNTKSFNGRYREAFLITDGEVYNTNDILQVVKLQANNTRYFVVGIGSGVSTELVKGIARAGRGQAEFAMSNDNLKSKVIRLLKLSMQPFLSSVYISAKDAGNNMMSFVSVPETIPSIFTDEKQIIYLIFQEFTSNNQKFTFNLGGKIGQTDFSLDFDSCLQNQNGDKNIIHLLCMRKKIQELELKEDLNRYDSIKQEIIDLATSANMMSRYTSFIGAEKSYKVNIATRETMATKSDVEKFPGRHPSDLRSSWNFENNDRLKSLLLLQNFYGYWDLNESLAMVLRQPFDQLKQQNPAVNENIWATILVIVFLRERLASQKCEWELIVDKARRWLRSQTTDALKVEQLTREASQLLKQKHSSRYEHQLM
ncbi:von Willebrand factor A domain-containing protein 5A-like [Argonauta hians]